MASDLTSFEDSGYPTITLICFAAVIVAGLISARGNFNLRSGKNGGFTVVITCIFILAVSVFLTFGPSQMRRLSVHFFILSVSGIFGVATGSKTIPQFFLIFGTVTFLCQIGSAAILGYSDMLHHISSAQCNSYFNAQNLKLCADDGYLQYLRVVCVFSYYAVAAAVVMVLSSSDAVLDTNFQPGPNDAGAQYNAGQQGQSVNYAPQGQYYQDPIQNPQAQA